MTDNYVFEPPARPVVTITNSEAAFPVNRIFCVGRNYLAHAIEMGTTVDKQTQEPIYFQKNPVNLVASGSCIPYPPGTADYHFEMELVVAIGESGFEVEEDNASELIFGYACGLDMTRRDLQGKAKDSGAPWDIAKDFEHSAVLSPIIKKSDSGILKDGSIELRMNGEVRQSSNLSRMIWSVPEVIAHLSRFYHLQPGDLIYTGTPEGVGAVAAGDTLHGTIDLVGEIRLKIEAS